jgi:hypothetical protein
MTWKDGDGRILRTLPSTGFWLASASGALLLVGGCAVIFLDFRDYRGDLSKSVVALVAIVGLGIGLIALGERPGRAHRAIIIVRNSLITLVALAGLLAVLLIIVGPLHRVPSEL